MRIKSVSWRNFNAYGSELTTLDFNSPFSLNLMLGKNGSGKSSAREAITFALFGSLPNKNNSKIVNRINKNLYVKIEFESRGKDIIVERGLEPNFLKVSENGIDLSDIAGKRNVEELVSNWVQIPFKIFQNLITLDINKYVSFASMSNKEKRNIIDKIFNLEEITFLYETLKEEIKDNKRSIDIEENKINWVQQNLSKLQAELNSAIEESKSNSKETINNNNLKIEKIDKKYQKNEKLKIELNKEIVEFKEKKSFENEQKIVTEHTIKNLTKKLELIKDEPSCPVCGTNLENDDFKNQIDNMEKTILIEKDSYKKSKEKIVEIDEKLSNTIENLTNVNNEQQKLLNLKNTLINENNILDAKIQQKIDTIIEQIKNKNEELVLIEDEYKKLLLVKQDLSDVELVLNEDGFRKNLIESLLPSLNKYIQKFSKILNLDFHLLFNSDFNIIITQLGKNIDLQTLSTGEHKKLDLVILFSLITLLKVKFSDLNLLFIDEIFSGLDQEAVNHIVDILAKISEKMGLHCFIINHSDISSENFNNIYFVEKKNGFSVMEQKNI